MPKTRIIRGDGFLRITPRYPAELLEDLRYYQRYLAPNPEGYGQVWQGRYRECFTAGTEIDENQRVAEYLVTFPGFLHRIKVLLDNLGWEYEIVDLRRPFPVPDFAMAMRGLREYQCECVWTALHSGGGIIACPTGWGKTHVIASLIRAFPRQELCARNAPLTLLCAPDKDLARQNAARMTELLPDRDVGLVSSDRHQFNDDIQCCTLDSLHHLKLDEVSLLILDEVHQAATNNRAERLAEARFARVWGASATPTGRYDGSDLVTEGLVGPVVYHRTYQQGVVDGALVPIVVFWVKAPEPAIGLNAYLRYKTRKGKYDNGLEKDESIRDVIAELMRRIPDTMQTLCIMRHTMQMNQLVEYLPGIEYVHATTDAKKLRDKRQYHLAPITAAERRGLYTRFRSGRLRKIMSTYVYKQGLDFPQLEILVQAGGGGSEIAHGQIPGRTSRPNAAIGKDVAFLVDFWHPWDVEYEVNEDTGRRRKKLGPLHKDDRARDKVYEKLGFDRHWIDSIDELPFLGGPSVATQGMLL